MCARSRVCVCEMKAPEVQSSTELHLTTLILSHFVSLHYSVWHHVRVSHVSLFLYGRVLFCRKMVISLQVSVLRLKPWCQFCCCVFGVELLTQWLWAQYWQVGGVTVPSAWPRGPNAMQVTPALIWLISLMSLFLGGPTNECDLNTQEPDGFASQELKTDFLAASDLHTAQTHTHTHT